MSAPAGAPASPALPGPAGMPRADLEAAYELLDAAGSDPWLETPAARVDPAERDAAWWAWCAEQVAAGTGPAADPFVREAAAAHWARLTTEAAARARAEEAAAEVERSERRRRSGAVSAFSRWLSGADEATRARVEEARAELAAQREAGAHVELLRARQAVIGSAQAAQVRALAALVPLYAAALALPDAPGAPDAPDTPELGDLDALVAEVAPALAWTDHTTTRRLRYAPRLVAWAPHTMARLDAGEVDLSKALVVAERTVWADEAVARRVDVELFGEGGSGVGLNTAELRTEADRLLARLDAAAVRKRSRAGVAARGVRVRVLRDGLSRLEVTGPTPAVAAVDSHLDAVARANLAEARAATAEGRTPADGGDPWADPDDAPDAGATPDRRGLDAHRFDALVATALTARPAAPGAARPAAPLELLVTLPGLVGASDEPGLLEGYGWVPGWLVEQSLVWGSCRLRRVLTDPYTGDLVTVDGHTYPASWLHGSDPDGPDGPDGGRGGGSSPPPDAGPQPGGRFRGLPVQQLPPTPTADDVLGPELSDAEVEHLVERALTHGDDPCADGTCSPVDPADCPVTRVGGGAHDPPTVLARLVRRAWDRCTGPGSTRRVSRADLDHVVAHAAGGPTCACNLDPKSRRWHGLKHGTDRVRWRSATAAAPAPWRRRFQHWRCDHGSAHWVTPLGRSHVVRPRRPAEPVGRFTRLQAPVRVLGPGVGLAELAGTTRTTAPTVTFPDEPGF